MKKTIESRHTLRGNIIIIATPIVLLAVGAFLVWGLHLWMGFILVGMCIGWFLGVGTMYRLDTEWLMDAGFRFGKEEGQDYMYFGHFRDDDRPKVICLCGSTRFTNQMLVKQWELTKLGYIVLGWCALPDWYYQGDDKTHIGEQEDVLEVVEKVHLRKIDLADEILVMNLNGYVGESTSKEIAYTQRLGKPVRYVEAAR